MGNKWEINPDDPYEIVDENGDVIARACNEPDALMAMSCANARLIATAPELLAACESALKALNELPSRLWPMGMDGRRFCPYYFVISDLLTVIAKATLKISEEEMHGQARQQHSGTDIVAGDSGGSDRVADVPRNNEVTG